MLPIKKTVQVTVTKTIEVEIKPSILNDETEEEFISQWCKGLWDIDSMDDVVEYAARMAAENGEGFYDGTGPIMATYQTEQQKAIANVLFNELDSDVETEILNTTP